MELKGERITRFLVEHFDLDRFITNHFKWEREPTVTELRYFPSKDGKYFQLYEFVALEEANNYASYDYPRIDGTLDEFEQKDMDKMLAEKKFDKYRTRTILQYLCKEGVIEAGDYMVEVFW